MELIGHTRGMTTWFRLPLIVRAAAIGVGWLAYLGLILRLLPPDSAARIFVPVGVACVLGSVVTAAADHRIHRKFGSVDRMTEYRRALRTGKLPKGVDVDEWGTWLRGSETANGLAVLCVLPFMVFGLFTGLGSESPYRWLPAAMFALLLGWGAVVLVRRRAGIKQLSATIDRRREPVTAPATAEPKTLMKEGVFASSLAGRLASGFLMWFAGAFVVLLLVDLGTLVFGGPWILRLPVAAGVAALVGLAWAVLGEDRDLRRNFGSYDQYVAYHATLRTGDMPADIEPEIWHRRLSSSRKENWVRAVLAGFFIMVGIATIVAGRNGYHWVVASLCQLLAIWLLINWWGARERLRRLAKAVDRQAVRQTWG
jgi:hypothetical protein